MTYVKTPPSNNTFGLLQLSVSDQRTILAPSLADAKLYSFLASNQFGIIVPYVRKRACVNELLNKVKIHKINNLRFHHQETQSI